MALNGRTVVYLLPLSLPLYECALRFAYGYCTPTGVYLALTAGELALLSATVIGLMFFTVLLVAKRSGHARRSYACWILSYAGNLVLFLLLLVNARNVLVGYGGRMRLESLGGDSFVKRLASEARQVNAVPSTCRDKAVADFLDSEPCRDLNGLSARFVSWDSGVGVAVSSRQLLRSGWVVVLETNLASDSSVVSFEGRTAVVALRGVLRY